MLARQSLFEKFSISALAICMIGSFGTTEREENKLRDVLAPVLTSTGSTARLYFTTQCSMEHGNFAEDERPYPQFPHLSLAHNSGNVTPLEAVREILRNQQDTAVTEDRSGLMRITIGAVPAALLGTRIARLTFTPTERWNPYPAIWAIERAPEIKMAMRTLNLRLPPLRTIDIILGPTGDNRYPHLPSALEGVTMDQALDAVATSFKQLVIYGECTQPNGGGTISIYFTPLTECDSHPQGMPCFLPEAKMRAAHSPAWPTPLELTPEPSLSPHPAGSAMEFHT